MDSYKTKAAKDAYYIARKAVVDNLQSTKYEDLQQIVDSAVSQAEEQTGEQVSEEEETALLNHINWVLTYNQQMEFEGVQEAKKQIPKENSKKVAEIQVGDILRSGEEVMEKTDDGKGMITLTLKKNNKERTESYPARNTMFMQKSTVTAKELEKTKETVNEAINYDNLSKHSIEDLQSTLSIKKAELKKLSGKKDVPSYSSVHDKLHCIGGL